MVLVQTTVKSAFDLFQNFTMRCNMKGMSRLGVVCGWLMIVAMVLGCTTAKPVLEWRDTDYHGGSFDNILIVGVAGQESVRRTFEESFVNRLREEQVNAVASFVAIPGEARPAEANIRAAVKDGRFDAVLLTHLVGVEQKEIYHPPTFSGGFYGHYGFVRGYAYEPGYTSRQKTVKLETNLYDVKTEKLVWSMQSATVNPSSEQKLIEAKIKTVVACLNPSDRLPNIEKWSRSSSCAI
jgi:hypothetical protein